MRLALHKPAAVLFALIIIACGGCKKNNTVLAGKIKSSTYTLVISPGSQLYITKNYTYDSQGRPTLTETYNDMGQLGNKITYAYSGNTLIETTYDSTSTTPASTDTLSLNSQGYVSNMNGSVFFSYDNNGYLISQTGFGSTSIYAYDNGNMIGSTGDVIIYNNKPESRDYGYAYSTSVLFFVDYGFCSLFGKSNTNLPVMEIQSGYGIGPDTAVYSYTFDSKGRVSSVMEGGTSGPPSQTTTYTYE